MEATEAIMNLLIFESNIPIPPEKCNLKTIAAAQAFYFREINIGAEMVTCKKYSMLHDKIKGIKIAMLTLMDGSGKLKSIPMTTMQTECEGNIWFFTHLDSEKTEHLTNKSINVTYTDSYNEIYVSISGKAELITNRAKISELWKPNLEEWAPGGLNNPSLVLVKVNMEEAEYWNNKQGKMLSLWDCSEAEQIGKAHKHGIALG